MFSANPITKQNGKLVDQKSNMKTINEKLEVVDNSKSIQNMQDSKSSYKSQPVTKKMNYSSLRS